MIVLHILQNFAPSNLNRDDTGSPKSAEFGGYRRSRISSQCIKRAIRMQFRSDPLLPSDQLAERTKRVVEEVARILERSVEESRPVVERALGAVDIRLTEEGRTQYLLYLGRTELNRLSQLCHDHWNELAPAGEPSAPAEEATPRRRGRGSTRATSATPLRREIVDEMMSLLDGGKAADLALFGRMLANLPERNVDAASQVAHALSTHAVSTEFDFYTAVDDLRPEDTSGAGMLGIIEFNSACYYRYSTVDVPSLRDNLGGDTELAQLSLSAFVRATINAIPTGKQNSFAAQSRPSLVLAVARERYPASLVNAFVKPARPSRDQDLVQSSAFALDAEWGKLTRMYGDSGIAGVWLAYGEDENLPYLESRRLPGVDALVESVTALGGGE